MYFCTPASAGASRLNSFSSLSSFFFCLNDVSSHSCEQVKAASTAADAEAAAVAKIGKAKSPHQSSHNIARTTLLNDDHDDDESEGSSGGDSAVAQELIQLGSMYIQKSDSPDMLDGVQFQQVVLSPA